MNTNPFYTSNNAQERLSYLSDTDTRLKEVLTYRYGKALGKNDAFMQAALEIRRLGLKKVNFLNERKLQAELYEVVLQLHLRDTMDEALEQEYRHFLRQYIQASYTSFSRPAFLNMGKRTKEVVLDEVKNDLQHIFYTVPRRLLMDRDFKSLFQLAKEEFVQFDGE